MTDSNVFLVINKMYYPEIGGIETATKTLSETIIKANIGKPFVITFNKNNTYSEEEINGVRIIRLPTILQRKSIRISPFYKKVFLKFATNAKKVIFNFPSGQPELYFPLYKLLLCEKICFYHADIEWGFLGLIYNNFFVKQFLDVMDKIIITSPNIAESSNILKKYKTKTTVVPLFVDIRHFYPRNSNKREYLLSLFPKKIEKIVLYVGRLVPYKGLEYLLEAVANIAEKYGLAIIGKGSSEKKLKQMTKELGIEERTLFLDHVPYEELPEYYSSADVFVLPSISRAEAFGLVVLEAMACGIPVITTEIGTGTSYHNIQGQTGLIIPPQDPETLARAITTICEENWKVAKSLMMLKRAKEFSIDRFVERTTEVLT